jgi:hypothetical protein
MNGMRLPIVGRTSDLTSGTGFGSCGAAAACAAAGALSILASDMASTDCSGAAFDAVVSAAGSTPAECAGSSIGAAGSAGGFAWTLSFESCVEFMAAVQPG